MASPSGIPLPPPPLAPPPVHRFTALRDLVVGVLGGFAVSGTILLAIFPPVALVWGVLAPLCVAIAVRRARQVLTVTLTTVVVPVVTSLLATCLSGMWGWLVVGLVLGAAAMLVVTPIAFGLGRVVRPYAGRLGRLFLAVVVVAGLLAAGSWAVVIGDALAPGTCPPGPGA